MAQVMAAPGLIANSEVASGLQLTEMQIAELREAFQLFDKDGDGHVTEKELLVVLQSLGQQPSIEEVKAMINEIDKDGNGELEFEEFALLMTKKMNEKEDPATLTEAFKILDADGSGSISREEMRTLMLSFSKMGENVPDGDIDALLQQADVDGDGEISYDEFAKIMYTE